MNLIERIKMLAAKNPADTLMQKIESDRLGAEAERRGLFQAYLQATPGQTFTEILRERATIFAFVTDDELRAEFARRTLVDDASLKTGEERGFGQGRESGYVAGCLDTDHAATLAKKETRERVAKFVRQQCEDLITELFK